VAQEQAAGVLCCVHVPRRRPGGRPAPPPMVAYGQERHRQMRRVAVAPAGV